MTRTILVRLRAWLGVPATLLVVAALVSGCGSAADLAENPFWSVMAEHEPVSDRASQGNTFAGTTDKLVRVYFLEGTGEQVTTDVLQGVDGLVERDIEVIRLAVNPDGFAINVAGDLISLRTSSGAPEGDPQLVPPPGSVAAVIVLFRG